MDTSEQGICISQVTLLIKKLKKNSKMRVSMIKNSKYKNRKLRCHIENFKEPILGINSISKNWNFQKVTRG